MCWYMPLSYHIIFNWISIIFLWLWYLLRYPKLSWKGKSKRVRALYVEGLLKVRSVSKESDCLGSSPKMDVMLSAKLVDLSGELLHTPQQISTFIATVLLSTLTNSLCLVLYHALRIMFYTWYNICSTWFLDIILYNDSCSLIFKAARYLVVELQYYKNMVSSSLIFAVLCHW